MAKVSIPVRWRDAIAQSRSLSPRARLVAHTLSTHMTASGESCYPSLARIARECGYRTTNTREAIRELEDAGYLVVLDGGGRGRTNLYAPRFPSETPREETLAGSEGVSETPRSNPSPQRREGSAPAEGGLRPSEPEDVQEDAHEDDHIEDVLSLEGSKQGEREEGEREEEHEPPAIVAGCPGGGYRVVRLLDNDDDDDGISF